MRPNNCCEGDNKKRGTDVFHFNLMIVFAYWPRDESLFSLHIHVFRSKKKNEEIKCVFNFCFSAKTLKIVDRTTQEGGGGVHSQGNFCP